MDNWYFKCYITKHSDRSSSQLDKAAAILAELKQPVVIAKVDADKYSRVASKHEIEYVCFIHISYYYNYFVESFSQYATCFLVKLSCSNQKKSIRYSLVW